MSPPDQPRNLVPVTCPICGESQNTMTGGFDADGLPTGQVNCMVCKHPFGREEYLRGLETRRQAFTRLSAPGEP